VTLGPTAVEEIDALEDLGIDPSKRMVVTVRSPSEFIAVLAQRAVITIGRLVGGFTFGVYVRTSSAGARSVDATGFTVCPRC